LPEVFGGVVGTGVEKKKVVKETLGFDSEKKKKNGRAVTTELDKIERKRGKEKKKGQQIQRSREGFKQRGKGGSLAGTGAKTTWGLRNGLGKSRYQRDYSKRMNRRNGNGITEN